jgi:hypothetical protein
MKKVLTKLQEKNASEETINAFKKGAPAGVKKLLANYDNYDVLMGQSMDGDAMYVEYLSLEYIFQTSPRSLY